MHTHTAWVVHYLYVYYMTVCYAILNFCLLQEESNSNLLYIIRWKTKLLYRNESSKFVVREFMARISYQNSTFRSFYKFDIRLLNWTFILFISTFVLFASAFVFQGGHSFYINNIRFSKWTFIWHKQHSFFKVDIRFT